MNHDDDGVFPISDPGHGTVPDPIALTQGDRRRGDRSKRRRRLVAGSMALVLGLGLGGIAVSQVAVEGHHPGQAVTVTSQGSDDDGIRVEGPERTERATAPHVATHHDDD